MKEITRNHIEKAYEVAKEYKKGNLKLRQASEILINVGMSQSSARGYIYSYLYMIEGKGLTRTINAIATEYFLEKIWEDNGVIGLKKALSSLSQHFEYYKEVSGNAKASHQKIYDKYALLINLQNDNIIYPDEVDNTVDYLEGQTKSIEVNSYERNRAARLKCIEHFGTTCQICEFNFENKFGDIGSQFIHVHHKIEISTIGQEYTVNPLTDLIPVCPNCHSMLHKKKPAYTVEELKNIITANHNSSANC